jgi:phenylacetate-coenzyme A ligase PaaK-like adenylate-forming protein
MRSQNLPTLFHHDAFGGVSLIGDSNEWRSILSNKIDQLRKSSPFYNGIMERFGINKIPDTMEIFDNIPPTTKKDYREFLQLDALSYADEDLFTAEYSSGSTSECVLRICTHKDDMGELLVTERVFDRIGMGPDDCFVCIEVGSLSIHDFYIRAARNLGVKRNYFLHLTKPYNRSISSLSVIKPSILLTIPSLFSKCHNQIVNALRDANVQLKAFIYMGEAMPESLAQIVKKKLNCPIYSFYGTTETGGIGGSCINNLGNHFDLRNQFFTMEGPVQLDDYTWQGEALVTSLNIYTQPVIKYRIGDLIRLTNKPCECGDVTPRISIISRTIEEFVVAAEKFSYSMFFESFKDVVPSLDLMSIHVSNIPGKDKDTLLEFILPLEHEKHSSQILDILENKIFELDTMHRFGLVQFKLKFQDRDILSKKKTKKLIDLRE